MKARELEDQQLRAETAPIRERILAKFASWSWPTPHRETGIPGLSLHRVSEPTGLISSIYRPSLSLIIRGRKRVLFGGEALAYDESRFLLTAIDLPTTVQLSEASEAEPYCGAVLQLDIDKLRRLIAEHDIQTSETPPAEIGMALGPARVELFEALWRMISLMDTPQDIPFLADQIHNEILYRLLSGEQGARLRHIALSGTQSNRVARAVSWLKQNYAEPLRVEQLADIARMGVSTLHHHFRAMTAMSPLQFQKHLRLHHARELMLNEAMDAASAALRVGYESPTQFNREYRRMFGAPPMRDVRAIRRIDAPARRLSSN